EPEAITRSAGTSSRAAWGCSCSQASKNTASTAQVASSISFGQCSWNFFALLLKKGLARSAGFGSPSSGWSLFHAATASLASRLVFCHSLTAALCLSSAFTHTCATPSWASAHSVTGSGFFWNQSLTSFWTVLPVGGVPLYWTIGPRV